MISKVTVLAEGPRTGGIDGDFVFVAQEKDRCKLHGHSKMFAIIEV